jgi:hypothetical protein
LIGKAVARMEMGGEVLRVHPMIVPLLRLSFVVGSVLAK